MRLLIRVCLAGLLCVGITQNLGCPPRPVVSDTVTIEYVNSTNADVLVDLLVSDDPNITQDELLAGGTLFRDTVSIDPVSFDLPCVDAEAIIIDSAVLLITDGPAVGSTILYQDLDYFCGEVISFEFTTNADESQMFVSVDYFAQ